MNDIADFPPIVAPVTEVLDAAPVKAPAENAVAVVRRATLAELSAVERGIAQLKADHGATDYDIECHKRPSATPGVPHVRQPKPRDRDGV